MVGPEKLPMGSTSSLCHLLAQPDPRSDVGGEHHHHAEEGPRRGEDEGARFTRLTMRVAEMIKLQSDAKRGMYTCLEYEHRGQKLGEKVGLVDRRAIPIGNEAGDALCMLDLFSNICSHMHVGD